MAKKHTHKYHKISIAAGNLWACALSDCNHYMPKHLENTILGKKSICWKCEEEFVLNAINMKNDMPICSDCDTSKKSITDALEHFGVKVNEI